MPFRYPDILLYYQTRQSRNRMFARYGLSLSFGKDGHRSRALPQCADLECRVLGQSRMQAVA